MKLFMKYDFHYYKGQLIFFHLTSNAEQEQ